MRAVYHPEAEAELLDAARFYETRVATFGVQFLDAVDKPVASILEAPQRPPIIDGDVRRYLMARFPYGIYYRVLQIICESWHSSITAAIRITGDPAWPISSEMAFG